MLPEYALLSRNERGGLIEEEHFGIIIEYSKNGIRKIAGNDNGYPFCLRSCMKPMQLAAVSEIIEAFNFTPEEIAVSTASHSGEDFHIETISGILKKIGLKEKNLLCPPQNPLNIDSRKKLIIKGQSAKAIHNNCSGKHAAMLAYCVLKGWDIKNYTDINHPLQKHILNFASEICEMNITDCHVLKDGCTLPVIAAPLSNIAKGFFTVYQNYPVIKNAVIENPYYAGGHGRLDSEIIAAGGGNLAAKVGAGNLCCVADFEDESCYVIKILDGDNFARGLILTELLKREGKLKTIKNSALKEMFSNDIADETGFVVGKIELCI